MKAMLGGACARCSNCGINWPTGTAICANCQGKTDYITGQIPHTPEQREALMSTTEDTRKMDKTEAWRFDQLLAHGLDLERAQAGAADRSFNIEQFRSLRQRGCRPALAWEIVR